MSAGDPIFLSGIGKADALARLTRRELRPTENESLPAAERRWQAENDPLIATAFSCGATMREIAERVGMSTTAIGNSLKRSDLKPPRIARPPRPESAPVDYRVLIRQLEDEREECVAHIARLSEAISTLTDCLPWLQPDAPPCQSPVNEASADEC